MQKNVYISPKDKDHGKVTALLKKLNCEHPNAFPSGWRELTPLEFARSQFGSYTPEFEEYRQMIPGDDEKREAYLTYNTNRKTWERQMMAVRLYYFADSTGVAILTSYWNTEKPLRFFAFGCAHDYREMGQDECAKRNLYHAGRCYHVYECKKCNDIMSQDSSD